MTKTLLEKAKQYKSNRKLPTDEEIELAVAWMKGEIGLTAISRALEIPLSGNILYKVAVWLRTAYSKDKIIIK